MAELVDGDHWRIAKDVAIRVHTEPRKGEYNTMIDGELPEGFQDSGLATVRKIFRNGDVKTNETALSTQEVRKPISPLHATSRHLKWHEVA